ncbi:AbrB/MazE/SpoVT family DNA-binding domain-containing protein [Paenibacillus senegalensis]|uniref:AbrB/MazE/SpoVT family DNA-binding domain-containing protein n=1 Tax=Paenibacillus senegalensis TaxID=1465766 RepID=UPI000289498A|nr:AbrB/MazE/SpoVT family DNA-binding domain-containing protein [Paenibacillus senegalensis]
MKATGIVRRVDHLGRIVIPVELRRTLGIQTADGPIDGDSLEIYMDGERIILKKYAPGCHLCGEAGLPLQTVMSKPICGKCVAAVCRQAGC